MDPVCFHIAFPIGDVAAAKTFYGEGLGCDMGRETPGSLILNLRGHQLVGHVSRDPAPAQKGIYPRHFGLIFAQLEDWEALRDRAQAQGLTFYQDPKWRFQGTPLEHATFFLADPFHNLLEFKFYRHPSAIFGEHDWKQIGDVPAADPSTGDTEGAN